ncbi:MAG: nucleotidyltransferase domain-containing protein [Candidatus Paceibacteria bacterium]
MGQIFTWDAIQHGRIPNKKSFHHVAKELRSRLAGEDSIIAAALFGSVLRGDFTIRSDIDCAVIHDTDHERTAMGVMHKAIEMATALYVPINFTPCDVRLAETRYHHFGPSFQKHLESSMNAGGLIKGDLIDLLAPTVPVQEEIEWYIKMKMYNLQESLTQMPVYSEERMTLFLKKVLEAPMHVARKMLIYEGCLLGDSKSEVQEQYRDTFPTKLAQRFDDLLKLDHEYSTGLDHQMKSPDQEKYEQLLLRIKRELPHVLEFLRGNIVRLDETH